MGERRVAEALRARATDPDPATGRQEPGVQPAQPAERKRDRQDQEHQRARGWTVPEPPPRAEPWLPMGRNDDQERDSNHEDR